MNKLFQTTKHAKACKNFRPTYPETIAKIVLEYAYDGKDVKKVDHILDVGCGNGQSTAVFQPFAKKITGIDKSEQQIKETYTFSSNINYIVSNAENISLPSKSVDIVTVGQAIHWFDIPKFFEECNRVLKPKGCLAMFGYCRKKFVSISNNHTNSVEVLSKMTAAVNHIFSQLPWDPRNDHVFNHYADIYKMITNVDKQRVDNLKMTHTWNLQDLHGYLTSLGSYQTYTEQPRNSFKNQSRFFDDEIESDIVDDFLKKCRTQWMISNNDKMEVEWNIFMVLAKNPIL